MLSMAIEFQIEERFRRKMSLMKVTCAVVNDKHSSPPLKLRVSGRARYFSPANILPRPHVVFALRCDDGNLFSYPQYKLIHIAGMVRHLAIEYMTQSPPTDIPDGYNGHCDWVDRYVAGHTRDKATVHRQFSYLPLPSLQHRDTDQTVQRVLVAAPEGDEQLLDHLSRRLSGQQLRSKRGHEFGKQGPPALIRVRQDWSVSCYTSPAAAWASVTPVILDGHVKWRKKEREDGTVVKVSDHDKWIRKALNRAGISQPCIFEWRTTSRWPNSPSAHKHDFHKRPIGYIRPDHLLSQTAVHLVLQFNNGPNVPGPLVIGAGRHCGLGIMAGTEQ